DVLGRAEKNAAVRFAGEPDLEGAVRFSLGQTYSGLSLYPQAQAQLEKAIALLKKSMGDDDLQTLSAVAVLAYVLPYTEDRDRAESLLRDAVRRAEHSLPHGHRVRLQLLAALGETLQGSGHYAEAEPMLRDVVAAAGAGVSGDDPGNAALS